MSEKIFRLALIAMLIALGFSAQSWLRLACTILGCCGTI
jgi:hypothetical protein